MKPQKEVLQEKNRSGTASRKTTGGLNQLYSRETITETGLFKYNVNFTTKNWKFSDKKKSDIFSYFC